MKFKDFQKLAEEKRWFIPLIAIIGFISIILLLSAVKTCRSIQKINDKVNSQNAPSPTPVIIEKYDIATQTKIDSIEAHRQRSHCHVDNLYDNELQDLLDSVYNSR